MARSTLNLLIDLVAFAVMTALAATGLLMAFVLPPRSGRTLTLWGLDRHEWGDLHLWLAAALAALLLIHLALHWSWLWCMIRRVVLGKSGGELKGQAWLRILGGAAAAIVLAILLALFILTARANVEQTTDPRAGQRRRAALQPSGNMTPPLTASAPRFGE